jgi:MFS family permease
LRGWTLQFVLLAALPPFFAAVVDLFARSRRRRVALLPALRSLRSRMAVWGWAGLVFAVFVALGLFPEGVDRPIAPDTFAATDWPLAALGVLCGLVAVGWLLARPRLTPSRAVEPREKLAGHLAAMLALVLVAVVVAATNPYTLILLLPSLHAWLWLPHVAGRGIGWRAVVWAVGLAGPLMLLASFAFRFDLGFDAPWYVAALAAVGYVPLPLLLAFLLWGAAAGQLAALAFGRYAPYPERSERPARGPIREAIRQLVFLGRRRRAHPVPREPEQADALGEFGERRSPVVIRPPR